ncbi:DUF2064 domain-containing protein [Kitasatospora sp. NPDC094015]|uniref:TIGR04282 family arsenosugar biosynthesis glycosyltransferase n=1 Tax=Kitasatospora sp. NPDC094015 TaxID=3155205 RepID=UPI003325A40C
MRAVLAAPPPTLLVIAKEPLPGRVKTRLTPFCSPEQAAALAEAALRDTLMLLDTVPAGMRVLVLEGEPGPWLPAGWHTVPQGGAGLDERLAAALGHAPPHAPALLVGMDTPQLAAGMLAGPLSPAVRGEVDAWFGPATDGGFWALGLAAPSPRLAGRILRGVPMSTADTGRIVLQRLETAGLRVHRLPELTDVDTPADARAVAALAPHTHFARTWHSTERTDRAPRAPAGRATRE